MRGIKILAASLVVRRSSWLIRRVVPDNVHLANEDGGADGHGDGDDRKVHACKVGTPDANVFSGEDVPPQETSQ